MNPLIRRSLLLFLGASLWGATPLPAQAGPLAARLDSIFGARADAASGWAVSVRNVRTRESVYEHQPARMVIPASTMKIVTASLALSALGGEYGFETRFYADGAVRAGVLEGNLLVQGMGDPTFSSRFHKDPRDAMRPWADSLRAKGIVVIRGGVAPVMEDFESPFMNPGWERYGEFAAYAAPFGALLYNDGKASIRLRPGANAGSPTHVLVSPGPAVEVVNEVVTGSPRSKRRVRLVRTFDGRGVVLQGSIPAGRGDVWESVSIRTPAYAFTSVLASVLREAGIQVHQATPHSGGVTELPLSLAAPLFTHRSETLAQVLPAFMKPSQNQITENVLRVTAREVAGQGDVRTAQLLADSILRSWELNPLELVMADGSGLSRQNRITTGLMTDLLSVMHHSPWSLTWWRSFPTAGRDGTLKNRLRGTPAEGRVWAKTGTLNDVKALAGYLESADGELLAFSIIANHSDTTRSDMDRTIDRAVLALLRES